MAKKKAKVTFKFDPQIYLDNFINKKFADQVGKTVVAEMKRNIGNGVSPVRGFGKFESYASQRGVEGGYPKNVKNKYPNKKTRPINLTLSGKYLKELGHWFDRGFSSGARIMIGFSKGAPSKRTKDLLDAHNKGGNKFIPRRPHMPRASKGEKFTVSIDEKIVALFKQRIQAIIKASKP